MTTYYHQLLLLSILLTTTTASTTTNTTASNHNDDIISTVDDAIASSIRLAICQQLNECTLKNSTKNSATNLLNATNANNFLRIESSTLSPALYEGGDVVSILNVSCFNSTTTKSFAFNLTNKQLKSIWNSSDLECSLTGNLTTINETSAKLVNISPYLDVNQIGFQVLVIMLFSTCISVCSSVNRRKENRTIARMPRGDTMFAKRELFKRSRVSEIAVESARPERLDKLFPHECCPEKWGHLGWTTPNSSSKSKEHDGFRYKAVISQSHVPMELLCGALSCVPKKKMTESTRKYLLVTVCGRNNAENSPNTKILSLRSHFETYCRIHEKAIYGSEEFNHVEFLNFQHVYNYLMKALVKMKVEEEQTRISNANKRRIMITKTRSISMNVSNDAPRQLRRKSSSMS